MTRDIAIGGAFALAAALLPAALALAPQPGAPVAVIAPPWADDGAATRMVAVADGVVISVSDGGAIAIATSTGSDFVARLYAAGAALVVDGAALSACLSVAGGHRPIFKGTST